MIAPRKTVLLSERLPKRWRKELGARGLQVEEIGDNIDAVRASHVSNPRALIVSVKNPLSAPREARYLTQCLAEFPNSLDRGILPVLMVEGSGNDVAWATQLTDERFPNEDIGIDQRFRPIVAHLPAGPGSVSQRCLLHEPGPSLKTVPIKSKKNKPIYAPDKILLQRAFSDAERIVIETLQDRAAGGGRSCVYKVQTFSKRTSSPIFWVAKTLPFARSDSEAGALRFSLPGNTPFANVPPLVDQRCVTTSCRSSIVMQFVDRANVLSAFLDNHSPAMAIASLFDGPLRCWRSKTKTEKQNIGQYGLAVLSIKKPTSYHATYLAASKINSNVRAPADLFDALRNHPVIRTSLCFSHGDLHLDNIFVRDGSNEVVLIDFNRCGPAPVSRDPAELDAALGFSSRKGRTKAALSRRTLKTLYSRPVLSPKVLCRTDTPRAQAVEQVRRQVVGTCSEDEYRLMLACHCLWWAKHGNVEAYLAADRLA